MSLKLTIFLLPLLFDVFECSKPQLMCYECSRGPLNKKKQLLDDFYDEENDESVKRALNHVHEQCGSNTTILDRTYRVYCPQLCQITYLMHDPDLTVIASCQSSNIKNINYKQQYELHTCSEDLCNSLALNQDNTTLNSSTNLIDNLFYLIIFVLLFKLMLMF